jgi:cytosine/adenosine deaminase-related metal-dependent hydrolase
MSNAGAKDSVTLVNADLGTGVLASLRLHGTRIEAVNVPPARSGRVLDLCGDRVLPGLINAHDHLQLNSFPPLDYPAYFRNATEWIHDFNTRLRDEPAVKAAAAAPRAQRLLVGGIKNLLCGVTTVAHHDPLDALLLEASFPTRVLRDFGWSHSLHVDGPERVRASCASTPTDQPWIVHAGEGVDEDAHEEFEQLTTLGCIRANTVLVHALGLDAVQRERLAATGAGVIWCPSSNLRLFGRTAAVGELIAGGHVALGTDSRLTGAADLLAELSVAKASLALDEQALERLVTRDAARLLRLPDRGVLQAGALADLLVLPAGMPLSAATRADVRLVVVDGMARYGDADYVGAFLASPACADVQVDGRSKFLRRELAAALASSHVHEPGVSVLRTPARAVCA